MNHKADIEQQLRTWFLTMTKKYSWLHIKFEYSESRGVFLVSFSPSSQIELSEEFNQDALDFADELNALYCDDAPLFTDEETLFQLSPDAELVYNNTVQAWYDASISTLATACTIHTAGSCTTSVLSSHNTSFDEGFYFMPDYNFPTAA